MTPCAVEECERPLKSRGLCNRHYHQDYNRRTQRLTTEYNRRNWLKSRYGITPEDYEAMVATQRGLCAICQRVPGKGKLGVDHDHETGAIRGLLCSGCNVGLGIFGDTIEGLRQALAYLEGGQ